MHSLSVTAVLIVVVAIITVKSRQKEKGVSNYSRYCLLNNTFHGGIQKHMHIILEQIRYSDSKTFSTEECCALYFYSVVVYILSLSSCKKHTNT